jgi:hypothetical protein
MVLLSLSDCSPHVTYNCNSHIGPYLPRFLGSDDVFYMKTYLLSTRNPNLCSEKFGGTPVRSTMQKCAVRHSRLSLPCTNYVRTWCTREEHGHCMACAAALWCDLTSSIETYSSYTVVGVWHAVRCCVIVGHAWCIKAHQRMVKVIHDACVGRGIEGMELLSSILSHMCIIITEHIKLQGHSWL